MDWTIEIPDGEEFIRVKLFGDYDVTANEKVLREISTWCSKYPGYQLLFDDRDLDVSRVTPNEMIVSNSLFAESDVGISCKRIAILISTDAEYDRAVNWRRMASAASMTTIGVFRDETEAVEWLHRD